MSPGDLLARARALGVEVISDGANLRVRGPAAALSDELCGELAAAKPALLEILAGAARCNLSRWDEGKRCPAHGHIHSKLDRPSCDTCGATDLVVMVVGVDGGRFCRSCRRTGGPRWGR